MISDSRSHKFFFSEEESRENRKKNMFLICLSEIDLYFTEENLPNVFAAGFRYTIRFHTCPGTEVSRSVLRLKELKDRQCLNRSDLTDLV